MGFGVPAFITALTHRFVLLMLSVKCYMGAMSLLEHFGCHCVLLAILFPKLAPHPPTEEKSRQNGAAGSDGDHHHTHSPFLLLLTQHLNVLSCPVLLCCFPASQRQKGLGKISFYKL